MTVVFTDLDDSLFQTARKMSAEQLQQATAVTESHIVSYQLPFQAQMWQHLQTMGLCVAVTGRSPEVFLKVQLPFEHAVCHHGAVVMHKVDGQWQEQPQWQQRLHTLYSSYQQQLYQVLQLVENYPHGGFRHSMLMHGDYAIGTVSKTLEPSQQDQLEGLKQWVLAHAWVKQLFYVHHNANNLSFLPLCHQKAHAVQWLQQQFKPQLSIGVGDSHSDLGFMQLCQYLINPQQSQINAAQPTVVQPWVATSYPPAQVTALLQPYHGKLLSQSHKEDLIAQGVHYGQLLAEEQPPTALQQQYFDAALQRMPMQHVAQLASHILAVARAKNLSQVVLVSLARAGTPVGVMLLRLLQPHIPTVHYTVSVVRPHGLDPAALDYLKSAHGSNGHWFFVDGWTGKGAIAKALRSSVGPEVSGLYCLTDPAGVADYAPTQHDHLIPHALLNATVSGLLSRTVTSQQGLHQAKLLNNLNSHDISGYYIDTVVNSLEGQTLSSQHQLYQPQQPSDVQQLIAQGIAPNLIKPSVGEATRAFLRRTPKKLLVRDASSPDVAHLLHMAQLAQVDVEVQPQLWYQAIAVLDKGEQ